MIAVTYLVLFFVHRLKHKLLNLLLIFQDRPYIRCVVNLIDSLVLVYAFDGAHSCRRDVFIWRPQSLIAAAGSDILFICDNYRRSQSNTPGHLFTIFDSLDPVEQCLIVHHVLDFLPLLRIKFDAMLHEVGEHLGFCLIAICIHEGVPRVSR